MIAKMWSGLEPAEKTKADSALSLARAIPDYRSNPGRLSVQVLERHSVEFVHFVTSPLWDAHEGVRALAVPDRRSAKYCPEDQAILLASDERTRYFSVVVGGPLSEPATANRATSGSPGVAPNHTIGANQARRNP